MPKKNKKKASSRASGGATAAATSSATAAPATECPAPVKAPQPPAPSAQIQQPKDKGSKEGHQVLEPEAVHEHAKFEKVSGDMEYHKGNYALGVSHYTKAIALSRNAAFLVTVFTNRALARIKMKVRVNEAPVFSSVDFFSSIPILINHPPPKKKSCTHKREQKRLEQDREEKRERERERERERTWFIKVLSQ